MGDFPRPELLTHPNIPKPLHGQNPRTILGRGWWDEKRREAYAKYGYRCWACGVHKTEAKYHQWLEGHEAYKINYRRGSARLIEIVALCHSCHNFIHSGRLWMQYRAGKISHAKMVDVLSHGIGILQEHGLPIFSGTARIWREATAQVLPTGILEGKRPKSMAAWHKWHLVLEGKKYYGRFKSLSDWRQHYA